MPTLESRNIELRLTEHGWNELKRLAGGSSGSMEGFVRKTVVDYLYEHRKVESTIPYQMKPLITKEDY